VHSASPKGWRSQFAIWLQPIELIAVDSQKALVIAVPQATGDWVQKRFGRLLPECTHRASRELRFADDAERAAFGHNDRRPTTNGLNEFTTTQRNPGQVVERSCLDSTETDGLSSPVPGRASAAGKAYALRRRSLSLSGRPDGRGARDLGRWS
jgi:hypothetical protein